MRSIAYSRFVTSQSESYLQILNALFNRPTPDVVELTFDTDAAARANTLTHSGSSKHPPSEELFRAISDIRTGAVDMTSLRSLAMSASSIVAATATLKRARHAGRVGKTGKGMLKRATQRTSGIFAMRAATAAAVTGTLDGVHGADPNVVSVFCDKAKEVFQTHGAAHMKSPLLRPRPNLTKTAGALVTSSNRKVVDPSTQLGGPAEMINPRGSVLLLPEDLTGGFGKCFTYNCDRPGWKPLF